MFIKRNLYAVGVALVLVSCGQSETQVTEVVQAQEKVVQTAPSAAELEVEDWYRSYAADWLDADIDPVAVSNYYASPFYYLAGDGPLLDTSETQQASLQTYADDWKKEGWAGARLLDVDVKILNASSAMIMTEWDIHDTEGNTIIGCERAPWTYLVSKSDGEWKLTLEIEIACGQGIELSD